MSFNVKVDYRRDNYLSEFSKKTLQDRYMIDGEISPQDAFARAAKTFASNEEHAQRLYDYASKLWFMFSTPVLSNGGTKRGLPISCFTGDTLVSTLNGAKEIKDIKVGDEVLTHTGKLKKVTGVRKSISTDVYELVVGGRTTRLNVTGNHLFLTEQGWSPVSELVPNSERDGGTPVAVLTGIDIESKDHFVEIKNPKSNGKGQFERSNVSSFEVSREVAWALGFWFAEGSVSDAGTLKTTHKSTENLFKWLDIMTEATGLVGRVRKNSSWYDAEINSKTLCEYFNKEFGRGALVKELPEWVISLPIEKLEAFYEGIYAGDGYKTTQDKIIQLSNPKLISGLFNIVTRLGIHTSLRLDKVTKSGVIAGEIRERRNFSRGSKNFPGHPNLRLNTIKSIEKIEGEYEVYDIEVEEDHSFIAAGVVAHNCFLNFVDDSREGITSHYTENAFLSSVGGGIGGCWNGVRSVGSKTSSGSESTGVIPFLKVVDAEMLAFSQGVTRRGSYASYLDISHPEVEEFLDIRKPTGGDANRKSVNLHHGVIIGDDFMELIEKATQIEGFDDSWDLIDPHSKRVVKTVSAKTLWVKLIQNRVETGEPYIMFKDTVQEALPDFQKELGLQVHHSNLCSEITLATDKDRTAVCCLSSVNLEEFDEWQHDEYFIPDLIEMLDNVLEVFIQNAPDELSRARYSAMRERSIGLGAMGFHAYLQRHHIPFESVMAKSANNRIFKHIKEQATATTERLAIERGPCPDAGDRLIRNTHLLAVAPNASSSIICGNTSPSIEPYRANAYTQKTKSGSSLQKNEYLEHILQELGQDTDEVWRSIVTKGGSIQHLDFLDDRTKAVFKTAVEIDQRWVIEMAADRQRYICQSQSLNVFFPSNVSKQELHAVHMMAWKQKVKTLYYLRSEAYRRAENVSEQMLRQMVAESIDENSCLSCEG